MNKVLRASKAGFPCQRNLWYSVNQQEQAHVSPKSQRIFDIGTALEPVIVDWLRSDGWAVDYNPGSQNAEVEISFPIQGGIISGHPDCIISRGEIQNALVDIKTMNDRSFRHWKREGTLKNKRQYVIQLHVYALGLQILGRDISTLGIVGVNKNNSDLHIDFFDFDEDICNDIITRAQNTFNSQDAPEPAPAEDWACSYCEFSHLCKHNIQDIPQASLQLPVPLTDDPNIIQAMNDLRDARLLAKQAKYLEDNAKIILSQDVIDKGFMGIQGGGLVFTVSQKEASRFDSKAFKAQYPLLAKQFTAQTSYSVFNIQEAQ